MKSAHPSFNSLLKLDEYINKKILFISEDKLNNKPFERIPSKIIRQLIYQGIKSFKMTWVVLRYAKNYDVIFIFEHKPWYSAFLYAACVIANKPVFFIVHGIQQTYRLSKFRTMGFKMLLFFENQYKFWPIHLEKTDHEFIDCLKFSKSGIILRLPFPEELQLKSNKKIKNGKLKIGIVGIIRPDKPIMPILEILEKYAKENDSVEVFFGTPFWQLPKYIKSEKIKIVDTTQTDQYVDFLKLIDVVVSHYEKESFYYRSSGVLNDSVAAGCFVLVPNYPVLKEQITNPVKVGETYNEIIDIKDTLLNAVDYLQNHTVKFEEWRQYRCNESVLTHLSEQIKLVLSNSVN